MRFGFFGVPSLFLALSSLVALACSGARPGWSASPLDAASATPGDTAAQAPAASPASRPEHALAKVPVSALDPQWGSVDAPVTIVEFSDFQCPFCSRVGPTLEALRRKYGPSQLRIVFKHSPLPFHESARPTAEAAAAVFMLAGSRGFFVFHDLAFAQQQNLSQENLESWAEAAGVQTAALRGLLDSGRAAKKVDDDLELARATGALGTPAFRINGVTVSGAQPLEVFLQVVDEQLAAARQLTLSGTPPRSVYAKLTDQNLVAPSAPPEAEPEAADTKVWNIPVAPTDPQRGPPDAAVTIVEFSEYQCPFCQRVEATLEQLRQLYGKDLRLVWKDNPLPFHARALPAAKLARAVFNSQGNDAFWRLHDALFRNQPALEDADFEELVTKQGLSWKLLQPALASDRPQREIEDSRGLADDFAASGTPHFFINGRRLSGAQPLEAFKTLVDAELAKARAMTERGIPGAQLYAELLKTAESPPPPETKHLDVPPRAAARGDASARVVIQVFSDFQCPYCKQAEPTLAALEREFKGSLRIVWRHLPLPFHEHAELAAEAAEEVLAQQGAGAFWAFRDQLFAAQTQAGGLERANLDRLADKLGLNRARFKAALDAHTHRQHVRDDADAATKIGIHGVPGFLINDYYLSGAQPLAAFKKLVKRALADQPRH